MQRNRVEIQPTFLKVLVSYIYSSMHFHKVNIAGNQPQVKTLKPRSTPESFAPLPSHTSPKGNHSPLLTPPISWLVFERHTNDEIMQPRPLASDFSQSASRVRWPRAAALRRVVRARSKLYSTVWPDPNVYAYSGADACSGRVRLGALTEGAATKMPVRASGWAHVHLSVGFMPRGRSHVP